MRSKIVLTLATFMTVLLIHCGQVEMSTLEKYPQYYEYGYHWNSLPITVEHNSNIRELPDVINYINSNFERDIFTLVDDNADIKTSVAPLKGTVVGRARIEPFGYLIYEANIIIDPEILFSDNVEYVIIHELTHALGFMEHIEGTILREKVPYNSSYEDAQKDFEKIVDLIDYRYF